jgi:VacB/RNase II family 3'-5' exoribonuclease
MESQSHKAFLQSIARKAMENRGLLTDFPANVLSEIENIPVLFKSTFPAIKDLRSLLWCSVDNEESLDLDQLSYAEALSNETYRLLVAIADVDAIVSAQSDTDFHAGQNTASVYTVAQIFPMLPEKLSTDLTSLRCGVDRYAIVVEMIMDKNGVMVQSDIYCALVCNKAKLAYERISGWLEGVEVMPGEVAKVPGLAENLKLQDSLALNMRKLRFENGALDFQTIETRLYFDGDNLIEAKGEHKNRAQHLIEELMIASNSVTATYLTSKNFPSLRRVVHTPKKWERIVEMASEHGFQMSEVADNKSLSQYLKYVKQNFLAEYPDLSLSVLKLLGAGEYIIEMPDAIPEGHFGLAVKNYSHSTAPNRRYPDLITHRLLKSAMIGDTVPYTRESLEQIARHCTLKEDDAKKVERQVEKSAVAMLMEARKGEEFDAIVSGAAAKGTWVRIYEPHLEGKLVNGYKGLEVGHKLRVKLVGVEIESGFIDFEKAGE